MFIGIQTRRQRRLLWATPLLFATLWVAYIVSAMRAPAGRIATALDWGVLTGGLDSVAAWQAAMADGSVLRLVSGLFLHADWIHLLGNLVFLLIFGLPAERTMGGRRFLLLFLLGGAVARKLRVLVFIRIRLHDACRDCCSRARCNCTEARLRAAPAGTLPAAALPRRTSPYAIYPLS